MKPKIVSTLNALWLASALWLVTPNAATAQPTSQAGSSRVDAAGGQSYILIRAANDTEQIQRGQLVEDGPRYRVDLPADSSLWLPRHRVLFVGKSLDDIYQYRHDRVLHWGPGDHFQMARWCLQYGLVTQASDHYQMVAKLYPEHASVRQLGVELREKMLEDDGFRDFLGLAATRSEGPKVSQGRLPEMQAGSAEVVTASAASSSPELLRHFSTEIQPILRNRCSQTACHGPRTTTAFQFLSPVGTRASQTTAKNLEQALKFIDNAAAAHTPLLRYATTAHGPQKDPAIKSKETTLIRLLEAFASYNSSRVVPAFSEANSSSVSAAVYPPSFGSASAMQELSRQNPVELRPVPAGAQQLRSQSGGSHGLRTPFPRDTRQLMDEIDALDAQIRDQLGEPASPQASSKPTDPFDASAFNQMRAAKQ